MRKDIYIIKNTINDKVYIGQSVNTLQRWSQHLSEARHESKSLIAKAMKKYGIENFYYQILESQIEDYDEKEQYYIKKYNSQIPNGYNISGGGGGNGAGLDNLYAKIKDKELLNNIRKDIKDSDMTFDKIADKYDLSKYLVTAINTGTAYFDPQIKYPLRIKKNLISEERFKRIVYSLRYEKDKSIIEIAKMYEIDPSTAFDINNGNSHRRDWVSYPIRETLAVKQLSDDEVEQIIILLKTTSLPYETIAKKFDICGSAVHKINEGTNHRKETESYPLRTRELSNRAQFSEDEIRQIEFLLKNSKKSMKDIAKEFNCGQTMISNINLGKVKKYYNPNIKYPIRHK